MKDSGATPSIPGVSHHRVEVNGTELHYAEAGTGGSTVLLTHGFPETWWAFRGVIPALAASHHVIAVDLRGFGDSANGVGDYESATSANDLADLIVELGVGPVHLTGQDISGALTFRLAATHPELVRSYTGIETGLPGFGFEALADVAHGGAWHIGVLAAPGIPEMLLAGREREFIAEYAFPAMTAIPQAITAADVDELVRAYSRKDGFRGASGIYRSLLREGEEIRRLASERPLAMPVLAVEGGAGKFTFKVLDQVSTGEVRREVIEGVGHYIALEAPERLAEVLLAFYRDLDETASASGAPAVVHEFIRAFNERDLDGFASTLHPEVEIHSQRGLRQGREEARKWATRPPGGVQQTILAEKAESADDPPRQVVVAVIRRWHWDEDGSHAGDDRLHWVFELDDELVRSWRSVEAGD